MSELQKFYFTFGVDEHYPFRGGWVEIYAENLSKAQQIFKLYYPHPDDNEILNCSDYYTEEQFKNSLMIENGNFGAECHAIIGVRNKPQVDNKVISQKSKSLLLEDTKQDVQWLRAAIKNQKEKIADLKNQIREQDCEITKLKSKIYDLIYADEGALFDDAID